MINVNLNRGKFILLPTIPDGTTYVSYTVSIGGNLVYSGGGKYFGGRYELDCRDWIEDYINNNLDYSISTVTVTVVFTYSGGTSQTMTKTWGATEFPSLPMQTCQVFLGLGNCGFIKYDDNDNEEPIHIPLATVNGYLDGKTVNKLEKTTSIDRYGNKINGSITNHYELECYVDPTWLNVETGKDLAYEKVMLALQNSKSTALYFNGKEISGMEYSYPQMNLGVHVKDVEKIETYSSYSTEKKVPTLKITLEVFNS